jgi:hypothetical protein
MLSLDTVTPLGVSAARVLEPVLGAHSSPLLWSANTAPVTVGPEQGQSQIDLALSYDAGSVAWVHFAPATSNESGAASTLLGCPPDRLQVEVSVRLSTSGGALDERYTATLSAETVDGVAFSQRLPLASLVGALVVTTPEGIQASTLVVNAAWDVLGFHGTLLGEVTTQRTDPSGSGSVGYGLLPYAEWPPPPSRTAP